MSFRRKPMPQALLIGSISMTDRSVGTTGLAVESVSGIAALSHHGLQKPSGRSHRTNSRTDRRPIEWLTPLVRWIRNAEVWLCEDREPKKNRPRQGVLPDAGGKGCKADGSGVRGRNQEAAARLMIWTVV